MAKELISEVLGACSTPLYVKSAPSVVEPFLNPPGKAWNILDVDRAQRRVIVALPLDVCLSSNSISQSDAKCNSRIVCFLRPKPIQAIEFVSYWQPELLPPYCCSSLTNAAVGTCRKNQVSAPKAEIAVRCFSID
jgi:hypothetical protein